MPFPSPSLPSVLPHLYHLIHFDMSFIRSSDVSRMDKYLATCRLRNASAGYLSDEDLRLLLINHPNPDHMVNKYHQYPLFTEFLDHLDPKSAGMFFDPDLLEQDCLPARYAEFRRYLETQKKLEGWMKGLDAVGASTGMMFWERSDLLRTWHDEVGQYMPKPRYELWETLMPRTAAVGPAVEENVIIGR